MGENCDGQMLGNRIKGKEIARGSIGENMARKCLADISNLPKSSHDMKFQGISPDTKEYIRKLHQENMSLKKLLADKIKIIQLHELEKQKFITIYQQVQQKNQQFAQTNSQLLGELNSAKDKLKVLEHELGCKTGLLATRNLESKVEATNCDDIKKLAKADTKNKAPCNKKRTRQSKSVGNNSSKPVQDQEKIDERRRSVRLKIVERESTEDVLETSDTLYVNKPTQNSDNVDEKRRLSTSDTPDLTTSKPVQAETKTDDKRRSLRRQPSRFEVKEEQAAVVESSDTLDLTTSKTVQTEMATDNKRQQSKRQYTRFKAEEEPAATVESSDILDLNKQVEAEKKPNYKWLCSRRQSLRLKQQEQVQEATKELPQTNDVGFSVSPLCEFGSTSSSTSEKIKFEPSDSVPESGDAESKASRPKRQATEKVQSYKEIPLNIKMRRT